MKSKKLLREIDGAMMDETQAKNYYNKMLKNIKDKDERAKIIEIRNDEIDHFKKLKRMKKRY